MTDTFKAITVDIDFVDAVYNMDEFKGMFLCQHMYGWEYMIDDHKNDVNMPEIFLTVMPTLTFYSL